MRNIIRHILPVVVLLFTINSVFAQFSGSGTENDPYLISNSDEYITVLDNVINNNENYNNIHFAITSDLVIPTSDIADSSFMRSALCLHAAAPNQKCFSGYIHGRGHSIELSGTVVSDSIPFIVIFPCILAGYADSIQLIGDYNNFVGMFVYADSGTIINCTNRANITTTVTTPSFAPIVNWISKSRISGCINYGNINIYSEDNANMFVSGISLLNVFNEQNGYAIIDNCINYGNICVNGLLPSSYGNYGCRISGITSSLLAGKIYADTIKNCINYGNITSKYGAAGIAACLPNAVLINCENYGTISGEGKVNIILGGIYGGYSFTNALVNCSTMYAKIEKCANYGKVHNGLIAGGISGYTRENIIITDCYNSGVINESDTLGSIAGQVENFGIIDNSLSVNNTNGVILGNKRLMQFWDDNFVMGDNNYFDKQMLSATTDLPSGKLTGELTGDSEELRQLLGDGWSYASDRYPIPLGLENREESKVFYSPIYLYAGEEDYDHLGAVAHSFTTSTANSVEWSAGDKLRITDNIVDLMELGYENMTATLGEHTISRTLNIIALTGDKKTDMQGIEIFPNPTSESINIVSGSDINFVEIISLDGKTIIHEKINAADANLNVRNLANGTYVLKICTDKKVVTKQIVVSK